jgi:hypothetical protein
VSLREAIFGRSQYLADRNIWAIVIFGLSGHSAALCPYEKQYLVDRNIWAFRTQQCCVPTRNHPTCRETALPCPEVLREITPPVGTRHCRVQRSLREIAPPVGTRHCRVQRSLREIAPPVGTRHCRVQRSLREIAPPVGTRHCRVQRFYEKSPHL